MASTQQLHTSAENKNAEIQLIIYNSSSFGGLYDYALALLPYYSKHPKVAAATLLFPRNATSEGKEIVKLLPPDLTTAKGNLGKKAYFLYRNVAAPLFLLRFLISAPASLVIFNDFEQLTAFLWVPLFRLFVGRKHRFAIILHDPDRDAYPPSLAFTTFSMKLIMSLMDLGLYHEYLPEKPYYQGGKTKYIRIPHGILPAAPPDAIMQIVLSAFKGEDENSVTASIIGNIRAEKNYDLAIRALPNIPGLRLVFAGRPANTGVNPDEYRRLAEELGVSERILWIERFLSEGEMSAIIKQTDILLLYYARSFTSQSGVLNLVAPFMKKILVSEGQSSLATIVRRFGIGILAEPDNQQALEAALRETIALPDGERKAHWEKYLRFASWENNVDEVLNGLNELGLGK